MCVGGGGGVYRERGERERAGVRKVVLGREYKVRTMLVVLPPSSAFETPLKPKKTELTAMSTLVAGKRRVVVVRSFAGEKRRERERRRERRRERERVGQAWIYST